MDTSGTREGSEAMGTLEVVPERLNFARTEEDILEFWKRTDAFQTSLRLSEGRPEFTFYDGPPFATGLPHYGHILAGTIKDIVTRFAHQTGHYVSRRFGWDCHGLPVEYEIDKALNISSTEDVARMGIAAYNRECRSIVTRYCSEWEAIVGRMGRWIDFKNDYKTMEPWYMESVWWVFKQLHERGLVYRGFKVMPYSTACNTPLSNFEANLNYKDVADPAIVVAFRLLDEPDTELVAWTTTPWTLPSNLALCVHPELPYVRIQDAKTGRKLIMCRTRLPQLYPKAAKEGYKGALCRSARLVARLTAFVARRQVASLRCWRRCRARAWWAGSTSRCSTTLWTCAWGADGCVTLMTALPLLTALCSPTALTALLVGQARHCVPRAGGHVREGRLWHGRGALCARVR